MANRASARAAVSEISKRHGHIRQETLVAMKPAVRREVEDALLAKDKLIGHAVLTLAKNLYSSSERFVFELLQNADDNRYTRATEQGIDPYIAFEVHEDRIVVDCNEDGFTIANLQAICTVNESTKEYTPGYIGRKGIGFKSVFMVASRVDIQSGQFTFSFAHQRNDSGMGMITPIWNEDSEVLATPATRMTLHLHKDGNPGDLQIIRQTISKQFNDLQVTCLLFLNKIKKIRVTVHNCEKGSIAEKLYLVEGDDPCRRCLRTMGRTNAQEELQNLTSQHYHVTSFLAENVPSGQSNDRGNDDAPTNPTTVSTIVLAFPLESSSASSSNLGPRIENQSFFAFLPIKETPLKFLIHADFETNANRQDIVTTSARNSCLRDKVADAFRKAIIEFCEHRDLLYTWPLFLPDAQDDAGLGSFWSALRTRLHSMVQDTPCIRSRHGADLKKPTELLQLAHDVMDEEGNPLFDDPVRDIFCSSTYTNDVISKLDHYGLEVIDITELIESLQYDITRSSSKMRDKSTTQKWHEALASVLTKHFDHTRDELRALRVVPLRGGTWARPNLSSIYFPNTGDLSIPDGVGMNIVNSKAAESAPRKRLFEKLGVKQATVSDVRHWIFERYRTANPLTITLSVCHGYLRYLYLTHSTRSVFEGSKDNIVVYVHSFFFDKTSNPVKKAVYLPTTHPLGPKALLTAPERKVEHYVSYLHEHHLQDIPQPPAAHHLSWEQWLVDYLGIRDRLSLIAPGGSSLSDEWHFVHKYHPKKALHLLEHLWKLERLHEALRNELKTINATDLCAFDFEQSCQLAHTWLPSAELISRVELHMDSCKHFPFLDLGEPLISPEQFAKWHFLTTKLSVKYRNDTTFLLEVLLRIRKAQDDSDQLGTIAKLRELYIAIEHSCSSSRNTSSVMTCPLFFQAHDTILVTDQSQTARRWATTKTCLWDAPSCMASKAPLKHLYISNVDERRQSVLTSFFKHTLQIGNATCEDLLDELRYRRKNIDYDQTSARSGHDLADFDDITAIYKHLSAIAPADKTDIRRAFTEQPLIFRMISSKPQWFTSGQCIWASTTDIRGKVTLSEDYAELQKFFLKTVGVKRLTIQMLFDQLATPNPLATVDDIKNAIWSFNSFLREEKTFQKLPQPILEAKIFAVNYPSGSTELVSAAIDFAIVDRDSLASAFVTKIKVLDYKLEEVRQLRPFLQWTGLHNRYLSTVAKEITSVGEGKETPIRSPNRDLRRKAHGILRIAATFNSPRYDTDPTGFYDLLRNTETLTTRELTKEIQLHQDGTTVTVQSESADFHIREDGHQVKIYVPRDRKAQEISYSSSLPRALADWLMRDPKTQSSERIDRDAIMAITSLLACPAYATEEVLESQGIIAIDVLNCDLDEEEVAPDSDSEGESDDLADVSLNSTVHFTEPTNLPVEPILTASSALGILTPRRSVGRLSSESRQFTAAIDQQTPRSEDSGYLRLLQRVVDKARSMEFPGSTFDFTAMSNAIGALSGYESYDGLDYFYGAPSEGQFERNFKIGAAGELFVFELLSHVSPPLLGWNRDRWESSIRHRVKVHAEYHDLPRWTGKETADLTYNDAHGDLTRLLIRHGHLDDGWANKCPFYYIEVKTTTGPNMTPFYMSGNQYDLMGEKSRAQSSAERPTIYVIMRVYNLCHDPNVSVYIDPERLRLDNKLDFTAEKWSVTPINR